MVGPSVKRSFSHSQTGKDVVGFKGENSSLEDIFFLVTASAAASGHIKLNCLQRFLNLTL